MSEEERSPEETRSNFLVEKNGEINKITQTENTGQVKINWFLLFPAKKLSLGDNELWL